MRFNTQESTGSRVRLRYGVELKYSVGGPADFLLNVHAAQNARQSVVKESFTLSPHHDAAVSVDIVSGTRVAAFNALSGPLVVTYAGLVDIAHNIVDPAHVIAEGPAGLPASVLRFLYPSRYCQADMVQQRAWDLFGSLPRGYAQVRAVRDWVETNLRFAPGASSSSTSAVDTLRDGAGVCRDFSHTMISLLRALNYPARFVTGIDYSADPALGPTDFHAYVEVYLGGSWYIFDPTGISPVTGLLRIGTGRDAADVSFATIFGPVLTGMPIVTCEAVEDSVMGFVTPRATDLAVSTAP